MNAPHAVVRRNPGRSVPDETPQILAAGLVAHVGLVDEGRPVVIPMSYHFDPATPDRLWIHGSPGSRLLACAGSGEPLSIAVTIVDGLVHSLTARNHSMNYRSAVVFGSGRVLVDEATKRRVFTAMIGRYFAGRTAGEDYEAPAAEHLQATRMIEVTIEAVSGKARRGGPQGPRDGDATAKGSAGVIPP